MAKVKTNSFRSMLMRSNSSIQEDNANRIANATDRAHQKLIFDLQEKKERFEGVIEGMKNISTSNDRNSMNAIENGIFDGGDWVQRYHKNCVDLELITKELVIAEANYGVLFANDFDASTGEVKSK